MNQHGFLVSPTGHWSLSALLTTVTRTNRKRNSLRWGRKHQWKKQDKGFKPSSLYLKPWYLILLERFLKLEKIEEINVWFLIHFMVLEDLCVKHYTPCKTHWQCKESWWLEPFMLSGKSLWLQAMLEDLERSENMKWVKDWWLAWVRRLKLVSRNSIICILTLDSLAQYKFAWYLDIS